MGCKCQQAEKDVNLSTEIYLENNETIKDLLSIGISPTKQIGDKKYTQSQAKCNSFTDNSLIRNHQNKMQDNDRIFLCQELLNEINEARQAPRSYVTKIEKYKQFIYINDKGTFLAANRHTSIALRTGIEAFDNCIKFLNKQHSLPPLKLTEELQLSFPNDSFCDKMLNFEYLSNALTEKRNQNEGKYNISNFHYDKNICMPEISCIIQIIDDTGSNYRRRNNIFDKEATVIGINCEKINGTTLCYYLLFGNESKR